MALAVSSWNSEITDSLRDACIVKLKEAGCDHIELFAVPGSFELIAASAKLISTGGWDAVVAIGSIIQGETRHFEFISQAVAQGIGALNGQGRIPVILCVLTDDTIEQARARSGGALGNKGTEAAEAAVRMGRLFMDLSA
jgi:6,7-dimethyl-8-ribityllumazine synthase